MLAAYACSALASIRAAELWVSEIEGVEEEPLGRTCRVTSSGTVSISS